MEWRIGTEMAEPQDESLAEGELWGKFEDGLWDCVAFDMVPSRARLVRDMLNSHADLLAACEAGYELGRARLAHVWRHCEWRYENYRGVPCLLPEYVEAMQDRQALLRAAIAKAKGEACPSSPS